jgi:acyl carrier protein
MVLSDFYVQLAEILDTDVAKLNPQADLESLGWSSLAVVSFIAFADETFSVIIEPRKLAACKTVGDLVQLLDGKVTAA